MTHTHPGLFPTTAALVAAIALAATSAIAGAAVRPAQKQKGVRPAQEQYDNVTHSLTFEAFYGFACDDLYDDDGYSIDADIFGPQVRYTVTPKKAFVFDGHIVQPEFFALAGLGVGEGSDNGVDVTVANVCASVGASIKMDVSDSVSAFARAQVGFAYEAINADGHYGKYDFDTTEGDLGVLYGVGAGVEIALRDKTPSSKFAHSVTIGIDYIGSTAALEFDVGPYSVEADEQSYIVLSVGYRLDF